MVQQIDLSMSPSMDARCRTKIAPTVKAILKKTTFTKDELDCIQFIHYKMTMKNHFDKEDFNELVYNAFGMNREEMLDRMFNAADVPFTPGITDDVFGKIMSLLLRGPFIKKMNWAFSCYDTMSSGYLTLEDVIPLLKGGLSSKLNEQEKDDVALELGDFLIRQLDADKDGKVSHLDFISSVCSNDGLIEAFGPCLPDKRSVLTFLTTFTDYVTQLNANYLHYIGKPTTEMKEKLGIPMIPKSRIKREKVFKKETRKRGSDQQGDKVKDKEEIDNFQQGKSTFEKFSFLFEH